jgi:hypothetical protein
MHINQNITNNINLQGGTARNGFVGIGEVAGFYPQNGGAGPFSLLHLNGFNFLGTPQTGGYRNWMKYGVTSTHNQDLAFWGQRSTGGNDVTDVVMAWADNSGGSFPGPDNLVFDFIAGTGATNNDLTGDALNGREVMRMKATGEVGIGPRFNNANQPQSTLHQHQENNASSWMQITNQYLTTAGAIQPGPTPIGATNGLRWGILGDAVKIRNGNGFIYNQEDRHLIFSTNHATPGNITNTSERVRITSLNAPTTPPGGGYGVYNPGGLLVGDATRVSISSLPLAPVTSPLSLLHLGFNTSAALDGWRNWMEVGTYTEFRNPFGGGPQANLYTGLNVSTANPAGNDVVIDWGFVPSPNTSGTGGNRLKFIFTSVAGGGPLSGGANGLEAGHFWSDGNNTRLGVGNFAGTDPLNTLEIFPSTASPYFPNLPGGCSGLKFRSMNSVISTPINNPGQGVLSVDNQGNVIYVTASNNSGCCLGSYCGTAPNPLIGSSWYIPLNSFNYYFGGNNQGVLSNNVVIGKQCVTPLAKLDVLQHSGSILGSKGIYVENRDLSGTSVGQELYGMQSNIPYQANPTSVGQIAVQGIAAGDKLNVAIDGLVNTAGANSFNLGGRFTSNSPSGTQNQGLDALAQNGSINKGVGGTAINGLNATGVSAYAFNATSVNTGLDANASGAAAVNYGVLANASGATNNYGVYATVPGLYPNDVAGYFNGDVFTSSMYYPSDKNYKNSIQKIDNSMDIISKLNPVTYYFNKEKDINFAAGKQYGFISQEIKEILPEFTRTIVHPAKFDSTGKKITQEKEILALNYNGFIALLAKGMQEQQKTIEQQQKQIDELKNMVQSLAGNNSESTGQNKTINGVPVTLSDKNVVVLNQNVPNPFAESTVISYNITQDFGKAQIIFSTSDGKILKAIDITAKGEGTLNVFANDLSSGVYIYSLVIDGKVIDTKKMVKQN